MRTIEMTATIAEDGRLTVQLPSDILPGEHRIVLVIDEQPIYAEKRLTHEFPVINVDAWPEHLCLRREDLYDDRGR